MCTGSSCVFFAGEEKFDMIEVGCLCDPTSINNPTSVVNTYINVAQQLEIRRSRGAPSSRECWEVLWSTRRFKNMFILMLL